jgi:protein-S-isoprenylcysteine O-methyltransferase Ste14
MNNSTTNEATIGTARAGLNRGVLPLIRALTYATLFVALVLVVLPAEVLKSAGVEGRQAMGAAQVAGAIVTIVGGGLALWCVLAFAIVGRGTPAPFDPPRRLVTGGPYRLVRNPMYVGAGSVLVGAALFYQSAALLAYAALFFAITHAFVVFYEEPTLRRLFGDEYEVYGRRVSRWLPTFSRNAR